MPSALSFQQVILTLHEFWAAQGCLIWGALQCAIGRGHRQPGDDIARSGTGAMAGGVCGAERKA